MEQIKIDIGCGRSRKLGYVGIDRENYPGVDIICDLENGLNLFEDCSVDEIYSSHCFEHINNFKSLIFDCHDCLKYGGLMKVRVPHFSNPMGFSDPTHVRFFGWYSFSYFANQRYKRKVLNYFAGEVGFEIMKQKLIFKSSNKVTNLIRQAFQRVFNLFPEFYEDNLCWIFPCQEIYIELRKTA